PALGERPRRLALEVDDQKIVVRDEHLPEVVVAVMARLQRLLLRRGAAVDEREDARALRRDRLRPLDPLDHAQRLVRLLAHARAPGVDVLERKRLGDEGGIGLGAGERMVQLGRARGERLDQREVGAVCLLLAHAFYEAFEIRERVAPGVALVRYIGLQQRERRGVAARGRQVFDCAGERHAVLEMRHLGEEAADLELRMHLRNKRSPSVTEVLVLCVCSAPMVRLTTSSPASSANFVLGVKRSVPFAVLSSRFSPIALTTWRQKASSASASAITPTFACWRTRATASAESAR